MVTFSELHFDGKGYTSFNRGADTHWGKPGVILNIETVAAQWRTKHPKSDRPPLQIGHISHRHGGIFTPHMSHRNGIDVDMRPVRKDRKLLPVTFRDAVYDRDATREVAKMFLATGRVKLILFNDAELIKEGLTRYFKGHDNHLHIRFDL